MKLDINDFNFENWLFSIVVSLHKWLQLARYNCRKTYKKTYNIFHIIDAKGAVVNRTLPSLHEGSLEITLTVPSRFTNIYFISLLLKIYKCENCTLWNTKLNQTTKLDCKTFLTKCLVQYL